MKLTNSIENMKGQLMSVLNSDDGYKRITGLIDEKNKYIDNAEVKDKLDIVRREANVAIIRSFIGMVIELNSAGTTPDSFNEYKDCFEELEEDCVQELIDLENKKLLIYATTLLLSVFGTHMFVFMVKQEIKNMVKNIMDTLVRVFGYSEGARCVCLDRTCSRYYI